MATLEKIRSKSGLLLVVIGVALFAFIIGDFLNSSGAITQNTTVAKVGDVKIDVQDYQNRVDIASRNIEAQNLPEERKQDGAEIRQSVLDQMINEALFANKAEELGIDVTSAELGYAILGDKAQNIKPLPYMAQVAQQYGFQSMEQFYDLLVNSAQYQIPQDQAMQLENAWVEMENWIENDLKQSIFRNIFTRALTANKLDAKALYDENGTSVEVAFVKKSTYMPNDSTVITDGEIEKLWSENKNEYRLPEQTRRISYINFEIRPSAEDNAKGQKIVEDAILALKNNPDVDGLAGNSDVTLNRLTEVKNDIKNAEVKAFADTAKVNSVKLISNIGNEYLVAKLLGKSQQVDSMQISFVAYQGTVAQRDSILAVLNKGVSVDSIASTPGIQAAQKDIWVRLVGTQMDNTLKEKLLSSKDGKYFLADTASNAQFFQIYKVQERKAPVSVIDYATVTYEVLPSAATISKYNEDLNAFIQSHNTADLFTVEEARKNNYILSNATITASTPLVGNRIKESHPAISWAMKADKGQVSNIFPIGLNKSLLVVAVTDIYDDYTPARDPQKRMELERKIRNEKNADKIIAEFDGKASDLNGYASLFGTAIDSASVSMSYPVIANLGYGESTLLGQMPVSAVNELVGPVKTNNAVVYYQVISNMVPSQPLDENTMTQQFNNSRGGAAMLRNINKILQGNNDKENNMLQFYAN